MGGAGGGGNSSNNRKWEDGKLVAPDGYFLAPDSLVIGPLVTTGGPGARTYTVNSTNVYSGGDGVAIALTVDPSTIDGNRGDLGLEVKPTSVARFLI